jgi:sialidase-1
MIVCSSQRMLLLTALAALTPLSGAVGADTQWVEGFDKVSFHHNANGAKPTLDFRGPARGYMTAGWWAPGQMENNSVSWQTAPVPAKARTTFAFIGATSVLPAEFAVGPTARLFVNGEEALQFTIGVNRDRVWKNGDFELKYVAKRVEYPHFGSHRQFDLHGNSGVFQLTVPASAVEAGKPAELKVEILPFDRWTGGWFMVKERRDALQESMETLAGEVESLRRDVAVLNEQTHLLATQLYDELSGDDRFTHRVAYRNGFRHLHPADLIKLRNNELLLMTREGAEHISNDGDIVMLRSTDGGKTWGDRQVIAAIKDLDEREACGVQLKDGTIVAGVFYNGLYGTDGAYLGGHEKYLSDPDKKYLGAYVITSQDYGRTWSEPNYIDTQEMPFRNIEGPTDAPIKLPDGSILMAVIGYQFEGDPQNRSAVMLRSADKGQTWQYLSTIAGDPGGHLGSFLEPGIVRTRTGRIVAAMRNHGPEGAIFTSYSDDDGKTWSPVVQTEMIGHPADLVQLADGRLMATYGVRTQHAQPEGVRACFSTNNGTSWDPASEVQIRNDFANWDVGYPESLALPGGKVLTVYYYNLFGKYFIGSTIWKP